MAANTALNGSNFVFHIAITRLLTTVQYGEFGSLLSGVTVMFVLLTSLEAAVVQRVAVHFKQFGQGSLRQVATPALKIVTAATVIALVLSPLVTSLLRLPSELPMILVALWIGPMAWATVLQGALVGRGQYAFVSCMVLLNGAVRFAVGIPLTAAGAGVTGAIFGTTLSAWAPALILTWVLRHELLDRGEGPTLSGGHVLRSAAAIGGFTVLISLDTWMARRLLSGTDAGLYVAASTLGKIPLFLPAAINLVIFPRLAADHGRGPRARRYLLIGLGISAALCGCACLILVGFSSECLSLLFGHKFRPASPAVAPVVLGYSATVLSTQLCYFFIARGSRLSQAGWPAVVVLIGMAAAFHSSPRVLGLDVLVVDGTLLVFLAIWAAAMLVFAGDELEGGPDPPGEIQLEPIIEPYA